MSEDLISKLLTMGGPLLGALVAVSLLLLPLGALNGRDGGKSVGRS